MPLHFLFLGLSGCIKLVKQAEKSRYIGLGMVSLGFLTANAILHQQAFPAIATVEQDAEAIMIPSLPFQQWVKTYDVWRNFVFDLLSQRIVSMMVIIDEVAFRRMDARVASLLLNRAGLQNPISITHQEIASELGS